MKILFLSSSLAAHFGGAAVSESSLAFELSKDHDLLLLSRSNRWDRNFTDAQGLTKVRSFSPISVFIAFLNPWHSLNTEIRNADLFHLNGHWFWENYFFARLCCRYHTPYVLHPRGMLWTTYRRPKLKKIFNILIGNWIVRHADKVILLSKFEEQQCHTYRLKKENFIVIPNGIAPIQCIKAEEPTLSYFLYLGRIEARKNLEFLIRSFVLFNSENAYSQLRLVGPVERNYDERLKELIANLRLEKKITIEAPIYGLEKTKLLTGAIAVIYPAIEEPFGRTIFEAFAAGTLCILPEKSGGAEYVEEFAPNLIYHDTSEASLNEKLKQTYALPISERSQQIKICQSWVAKHLDWPAITERVVKTYKEIVAQ